jgi:hypothetical protein
MFASFHDECTIPRRPASGKRAVLAHVRCGMVRVERYQPSTARQHCVHGLQYRGIGGASLKQSNHVDD